MNIFRALKCVMGFHRMRWEFPISGKPYYACRDCEYREPPLTKRITKT